MLPAMLASLVTLYRYVWIGTLGHADFWRRPLLVSAAVTCKQDDEIEMESRVPR